MRLAALFVLGASFGLACTFPRQSPPRYYQDGEQLLYHRDPKCAYGHLYAYETPEQAEGKNLKPCPQCVSPPHGDKIADRDSHDGQQSAN